MFHSQTYGELKLEEIPAKIFDYFEKMKKFDSPLHITVGTDSQNFSDTKMVSVITVTSEGHGGIFFYEISRLTRISDVTQKLYTETDMSLKIMKKLLSIFDADPQKYGKLTNTATFTIHVDASRNEKGKTYKIVDGIITWIKGEGFANGKNKPSFDYAIKPNSYAASSVADRISK